MGSYAENEQDAREYAELQRQFAEENLRDRQREKVTITHDDIASYRRNERNLENAERHMQAQETWSNFLETTNNGEDYERNEEQQNLLREIDQIVTNNIVHGSPPYSLESAEGILLDIINDLTSMKERLGLNEGGKI